MKNDVIVLVRVASKVAPEVDALAMFGDFAPTRTAGISACATPHATFQCPLICCGSCHSDTSTFVLTEFDAVATSHQDHKRCRERLHKSWSISMLPCSLTWMKKPPNIKTQTMSRALAHIIVDWDVFTLSGLVPDATMYRSTDNVASARAHRCRLICFHTARLQ